MAKRDPEEYEDEEDYEEEEEVDLDDERVEKAKARLFELLETLDPTSTEYMKVSQRLVDIAEYEKNISTTKLDKKRSRDIDRQNAMAEKHDLDWFKQTLLQVGLSEGIRGATSMVTSYFHEKKNSQNVDKVIGYENSGEVMTSKATKFIK